mmetsp:Transcript_31/g.46  ORF Transcript_31/g.46 Transcript_31/m.46 type:complete len:825 (-) Transcript_31:1805-4279(-)
MSTVENIVADEQSDLSQSSKTKKSRKSRRIRKSARRRKLGWKIAKVSANVSANILLFLVVLFFITAAIGGILQLLRKPIKAVAGEDEEIWPKEEETEINWKLAREAAELAFKATYLAIKLWSRLMLSILLPASQRTWMMTKDGWAALQPSVKLSIMWVINAPLVVKAAFAGACTLISLVLIMHREIKKRKYVERVANYFSRIYNKQVQRYNRFSSRVERQSRFLGELLPHLIFIVGALVAIILARDSVAEFAKGLGGWTLVIGLPVIASTRALIIYDGLYQTRIAKFASRGNRKRRGSSLPKPVDGSSIKAKNLLDYVTQAVDQMKKPIQDVFGKQNNADDDDDDGLAYTDGKRHSLKRYKTLRGVRPMGYPEALDKNMESAAEQYDELHSVLFWLRYWTILAVALMAEQFPIFGNILSLLPFWPAVRMIFALWLLVPGTSGADLAFELVVPLVAKYWKKIELPGPSSTTQNIALNMVFSQLPVSEESRTRMAEVAETGGTLLFTTLPLLFMPSIFTSIGCVAVGLGKPLYSGIVSVLAVEQAALNARRKLNHDLKNSKRSVNRLLRNIPQGAGMGVAASALHCTQWLEYWVVYTSFMLVHGFASVLLFWFPLWVQMQLVLILWLQLPYFRGSRRVFKTGLGLHYQLRNMLLGESFFTGWFSEAPVERKEEHRQSDIMIDDDPDEFEVIDDPGFLSNEGHAEVKEVQDDTVVEENKSQEADFPDDDSVVDDADSLQDPLEATEFAGTEEEDPTEDTTGTVEPNLSDADDLVDTDIAPNNADTDEVDDTDITSDADTGDGNDAVTVPEELQEVEQNFFSKYIFSW